MKKLTLLLTLALPAIAEPVATTITVHVVARDAKLLYEQVGGARVTIADAESGRVLADGLHTGKSSGDTKTIMTEPRKRGDQLFGAPDAAGFAASIPLERPALLRITAEGPVSYAHARAAASKTLLVLPGEHITGDGVVLEIHGLIVNVQKPQTRGDGVHVTATVQMACGCPIQPDGIWNANEFEVTATVIDAGGNRSAAHPMRWDGGRWLASIAGPLPEGRAIEVIAAHTATANFGMHTIELE